MGPQSSGTKKRDDLLPCNPGPIHNILSYGPWVSGYQDGSVQQSWCIDKVFTIFCYIVFQLLGMKMINIVSVNCIASIRNGNDY